MKWDPSWLKDGTAVYYALSLDFSVRPFGHFLLGFPELLRFLSRATMAVEFLGPLLILSPWKTGQLRLLAVALFVGSTPGLALTMDLTGFSAIMFVVWLGISSWLGLGCRSRTVGRRLHRSAARLGAASGTGGMRPAGALGPHAARLVAGGAHRASRSDFRAPLVLAGVMTIFATSMAQRADHQRQAPEAVAAARVVRAVESAMGHVRGAYLYRGWMVRDRRDADGRAACRCVARRRGSQLRQAGGRTGELSEREVAGVSAQALSRPSITSIADISAAIFAGTGMQITRGRTG